MGNLGTDGTLETWGQTGRLPVFPIWWGKPGTHRTFFAIWLETWETWGNLETWGQTRRFPIAGANSSQPAPPFNPSNDRSTPKFDHSLQNTLPFLNCGATI